MDTMLESHGLSDTIIDMDETFIDWAWEPSPCEHDSGWETAYITPYKTILRCPDCGDERTVYDSDD